MLLARVTLLRGQHGLNNNNACDPARGAAPRRACTGPMLTGLGILTIMAHHQMDIPVHRAASPQPDKLCLGHQNLYINSCAVGYYFVTWKSLLVSFSPRDSN
jgi:hypothetical protein